MNITRVAVAAFICLSVLRAPGALVIGPKQLVHRASSNQLVKHDSIITPTCI